MPEPCEPDRGVQLGADDVRLETGGELERPDVARDEGDQRLAERHDLGRHGIAAIEARIARARRPASAGSPPAASSEPSATATAPASR